MNAEDLVLNFKKGMASLSKTERRRAIESVRDVTRAAAFDDAAGSAYEIERCPRCGSVAVVKKGKSKNGEQRYLCRGCGRTFGMGSERILGTSRLPKETWMAYAECFALMLPLRECARRCRVCLGLATLMWTVPGGAQETGGPYMRDPRHPRHFTDEFKRQIVDLYNAGKPKREIMDEYDLGKSTVERWIKSINATGSPRAACNRTPEQNRILELERENRRLRMEVDVLKQAALIYARK